MRSEIDMMCDEQTGFVRVLTFEAIHNFRDYGGYPVDGGGRLREGVLLRSAQHGGATGPDLDRVGQMRIAAIIDLRSDREREVSPCRRPADFYGRVLFIPDAVTQAAPHIEAARGVTDPETAAAHMTQGYAEMPFRPGFMAAMAQYFKALAEEEGPTLIHCMAGKDRTGIAVALFHRAMGVERADWLADYMMTNETGNIDARIAAGAVHVRAAFGKQLDDDTVRVLMTVRPAFIDNCFAAMDHRHGGVDGYLAACGVDDDMVAAVKARMMM
ncbi:MAG: tyrosine-protein phosphatase [Sphingobium sp.]